MSNKYWVWLSSIDNLSLDTIYKLLKIFKEPERIWYLDKKDLEKINLNKEDIDRILNIYYKQNLDNIMYYIKKNNGNFSLTMPIVLKKYNRRKRINKLMSLPRRAVRRLKRIIFK